MLVLFYEEPNSVNSFDSAVEFIKQDRSFGIDIGEVHKINANETEAITLIENGLFIIYDIYKLRNFCNKLKKSFVKLIFKYFLSGYVRLVCKDIEEAFKKAQKPDIVIDFTRYGIPSEAVKMIVKVMNLPTISAAFGQEGDIRSWQELGPNMKQYLIQVAPPADLLPQSVRSIASQQDMTSAVLLFDNAYGIVNHALNSHAVSYEVSLLHNIPTRQLLAELETNVQGIRQQVDRLIHAGYVNYFIAASPSEISGVLAEASDPGMRDGPYFSEEYAWYSMSMEEGLPKCSGCRNNVPVIHLTPKLPKAQSKQRICLETTGNIQNPTLMDMFYFDLTTNAILTVELVSFFHIQNSQNATFNQMKKERKWVDPPRRVCSETVNQVDDYVLPLFETFKSEAISKDNLLGPFFLDADNTIGKSHANFEMEIRRLVFKPMQAEPETNVLLGTWKAGFTEKDLIDSRGQEIQWQEHYALTIFRIVTVVQPPFVYKIPGCNDSKFSRCFKGYCIDLLNKIQDELKFNFTIWNVTDYGDMNLEEPHEWSGMVRELKDKRADIALGAMSVMPERESIVDFTVPYYESVGFSILMRKSKQQNALFKFLTVLENDVWMCILAAYFFTRHGLKCKNINYIFNTKLIFFCKNSFLMWIFDRWSPYSYQNNREKYEDDEEKREFNLKECLWFCMTSLTPQGGGEAPKNLSGRLVAATWWLFGFIIIASYTANLAAFLTVSRLLASIESLDDLAKQYKIQYAPVERSSVWNYFDRMAHVEHRFYEIWKDMSLNDSMSDYERSQLAVWDYPVSDRFTKMWQAMQENSAPRAFEDAIKRVRGDERNQNDGFAFIGDATDIRYQVLISCDLRMVGEEFSAKPYAIAVQQGSPLKEQLNEIIMKLLKQRDLEQLKKTWWNDNEYKATCPKVDMSQGISIHNIGGVFIVIFVGIVMTCVTLVFEYWWYSRQNIAEEMDEMNLPPPKEFSQCFSTDKTNFDTHFIKPPRKGLATIDNSW
ncbi:Glutamate receptor ionotropic, kainate 2 [Orchesella cincta]|uniref:Glutamate receptor ionotropic, kainate 2 n=1 Tax=Orchesella cincta TaxID=48709 RepID=A0A1D2M9P1_ORCCI|nr:Glutamate receptor ionotropic, kainate 2 [Orchesella cincta]